MLQNAFRCHAFCNKNAFVIKLQNVFEFVIKAPFAIKLQNAFEFCYKMRLGVTTPFVIKKKAFIIKKNVQSHTGV